jgi:hypothetical protein
VRRRDVTQDYLTDSEDKFGIATFAPELTRTDPEDEFVPVSVENEAQQSVEEAVQEGATPQRAPHLIQFYSAVFARFGREITLNSR